MKDWLIKGATILLLLAVAFLLVGMTRRAVSLASKPKYTFLYSIGYKVKRGDTLWCIAQKYYSLQDKKDIREFVSDIEEYNETTAFICEGQIINIPIYKKVNY